MTKQEFLEAMEKLIASYEKYPSKTVDCILTLDGENYHWNGEIFATYNFCRKEK